MKSRDFITKKQRKTTKINKYELIFNNIYLFSFRLKINRKKKKKKNKKKLEIKKIKINFLR